jgi:hypothetical protein
MALDPRKAMLISEFLEESFVGSSVYDSEDLDRVGRFYRTINDTTGHVLHRVLVSRAFFDDHAEAEIIPALQSLGLLLSFRLAGDRRVIVKTQMIEIEAGA